MRMFYNVNVNDYKVCSISMVIEILFKPFSC